LVVTLTMRPQPRAIYQRHSSTGHLVGGDVLVSITFCTISSAISQNLRAPRTKRRGVDRGERQARVVDEDIDAAETGLRVPDHTIAFARPAQVGDDRMQVTTSGEAQHLGDILGEVTDSKYVMAGGKQAECHGSAEPAQTPSDDSCAHQAAPKANRDDGPA
jgi:hypothetical protein